MSRDPEGALTRIERLVAASQTTRRCWPCTVALSATLSPAESLAGQVSPGDMVNVTVACAGRPGDLVTGLSAVTVLDVRAAPATPGPLPASMTVVLAIPASVAAQAARALLGCGVELTPAS
jgi:hypothetical protein